MIIRRTVKQELITQKTGDRNIYKELGEINRFGIKILNGGEQWIIDAKTGKPAPRDGYECMEGQRGFYLWVKKGEKLRALDTTYASVWDDSLKPKETK